MGRNPEEKKSVEIETCLLKYLKSLPGGIEHVVFYADTCGEQNRNQNAFAAFLYAVNMIGNIKQIDLKFMESGHSYLEQIASTQRLKDIEDIEIYMCRVIINVKLKCVGCAFPYKVYQNRFDDIYKFQDLSVKIVTSRKKSVNDKAVKWINLKWLRFLGGENSVGYKYDVAVDNFEYMDVNNTNIILWNPLTFKKKIQ